MGTQGAMSHHMAGGPTLAHDLVSEASDSLSAFRHHSPCRHWLPWVGFVLRRGGT